MKRVKVNPRAFDPEAPARVASFFEQERGIPVEREPNPWTSRSRSGGAVLVGVLFAVFSARKAARLNPLAALRFE